MEENFYNTRTQLSSQDKSRLRMKGYELTHWKGNGDTFYRIRNGYKTHEFQHLKDLKNWIRW